ncbi:MAG: hypothetical protein KGL53_10225, partial [Elusimicrobia bacterium]|nr:hypothetical protein [Elusimicrobiota bacterium]
ASAARAAADHSKFAELKGPFRSGPQVTRACLRCHPDAARQVQDTAHWTWLGEPQHVPGHAGTVRIGKANLLNNFCIGVRSNMGHCGECHVGYGWTGKPEKSWRTYDFKQAANVDCLACHDTSGDYSRDPSWGAPDWGEAARSAGPTSIHSCGSCHFNGGGGAGVKHGDLDPTLEEADVRLDVHMAKDGLGYTCSSCHGGDPSAHKIRGLAAGLSVVTGEVTCVGCHGDAPHGRRSIARGALETAGAKRLGVAEADRWSWQDSVLNSHTRSIACETCHVPTYARRRATQMWWDWSKAGRHTPDWRAVSTFDKDGDYSYRGIMGSFRWAKDPVPEYRWYDGREGRYLTGDTFDPSKVLVFNPPEGGPSVAGSKIWPFKVHRGVQPYDAVYKTLIQPNVWGPRGSGAYWSDFDWQAAARKGMKAAGLPFSGKIAFARTDMYWPLTHMVVGGDHALQCAQCHARDGRLAGVPGVYIPGESRSRTLDVLGLAALLATLMGVAAHAVLRGTGGLGGRVGAGGKEES